MDLEKENEMLRAEVLRQREQIERLEQRVDYVLRQLHSAKSEKFDPNQLILLDDESKKAEPSSATSDPEEVADASMKPFQLEVSRDGDPTTFEDFLLPVDWEMIAIFSDEEVGE